ncbi:unnamed protein product, partial [Effrenium voratum]
MAGFPVTGTIHWPLAPVGIPDRSSRLECAEVDRAVAQRDWQRFLCTLYLRRQRRILRARPGRTACRVEGSNAALPGAASAHLGGAVFWLALGDLPRTELALELGRLKFAVKPPRPPPGESPECRAALLKGVASCGGELWAGLTVAILDHAGRLGSEDAVVEVHLDKLHASTATRFISGNKLLVSLVPSTDEWAAVQAQHPSAWQMGSFIAPSRQLGGYVLPQAVETHLPRLLGNSTALLVAHGNTKQLPRAL